MIVGEAAANVEPVETDQYAPSLYDIDFESLRDKGIRGLILDSTNNPLG